MQFLQGTVFKTSMSQKSQQKLGLVGLNCGSCSSAETSAQHITSAAKQKQISPKKWCCRNYLLATKREFTSSRHAVIKMIIPVYLYETSFADPCVPCCSHGKGWKHLAYWHSWALRRDKSSIIRPLKFHLCLLPCGKSLQGVL